MGEMVYVNIEVSGEPHDDEYNRELFLELRRHLLEASKRPLNPLYYRRSKVDEGPGMIEHDPTSRAFIYHPESSE